MEKSKSEQATAEQVAAEQRKQFEAERQKLIVQKVKLPNGAIFTKLKPAGAF